MFSIFETILPRLLIIMGEGGSVFEESLLFSVMFNNLGSSMKSSCILNGLLPTLDTYNQFYVHRLLLNPRNTIFHPLCVRSCVRCAVALILSDVPIAEILVVSQWKCFAHDASQRIYPEHSFSIYENTSYVSDWIRIGFDSIRCKPSNKETKKNISKYLSDVDILSCYL